MLRIDLGCGTHKQPGFIGVDRYALVGVDIVADMNRTLPLRDDSVDLLLASHSLEHVETLLDTIHEVYRICKHGAQLCIVAPYSEQKLNWANPYHKWVFNEHTPRFWTDYPDTPVDAEEYHHPHAYTWGLSRTDNSNPEIDIRMIGMEYFYFPRYAGLPPSELRRLRQERTDVCEQIMYHLIVWKGDEQSGGRPFTDYVAGFHPYEPEYITQLRNQGQEMLLQERADKIVELTADLDRQKNILDELGRTHLGQISELSRGHQEQISGLSRGHEEQVSELSRGHQEQVSELHLGHQEQISKLCRTHQEQISELHLEHQEQISKLCRGHEEQISSLAEMCKAEREARAGEAQASQEQISKLRQGHQEQISSLAEVCKAEREARAGEAQTSERLRQELAAAKDEANQLRSHSVSLTAEITRLHEHCAGQTAGMGRLTTELHETATYNRILRDETVRVERELEFARTELRRESATAAALQADVSSLARQNRELKANLESNDVLRAKAGLIRAELETTATLLDLQRQREEGLIGEVTAARREQEIAARGAATAFEETERWKALWNSAKRSLGAVAGATRIPEFAEALRVGTFIIGRDRQLQGLPSGFVPLREYCDRHFRAVRACIVVGGDLTEVPYREYVVPFALDRLTAVSFAIRPMLPESSGVVGVEIVSHRSEILAHVRRELTTIQGDGVTEFGLPAPLTGLEKNWLLRVFARDAGTPVSVYELVRGGLFRGSRQSFPLVSFS